MSARPRLLIVKTSSLGDVVHALPAVTDLAAARPDWQIDWVCEEAFAGIPALHPAVGTVIPCAIRRWRRAWWTGAGRREVAAFRAVMRAGAWDLVLDLQGLVKSAWITRQAPGVRHGYDRRSAREPLACFAYAVRHAVPWGQHAIARNRQLMAAALGYAIEGPVRYGLATPPPAPAGGDYAVLLHATSRDDKLWPEDRWRGLFTHLAGRGLRLVLPWGSAAERARSERLAVGFAGASVPERMVPAALAELFAGARVVVGVDTGLVHLAAAVGAPALALFCASDPVLTGVIGEGAAAVSLGGAGRPPGVDEVIAQVDAIARGMSSR